MIESCVRALRHVVFPTAMRWLTTIFSWRAAHAPRPGGGSIEADQVRVLRSQTSATWLKQRLTTGSSLLIIGGGCIGLETAASSPALGVSVTVVERKTRPLARVASASSSRLVLKRHRLEGVAFALDIGVVSIGHC